MNKHLDAEGGTLGLADGAGPDLAERLLGAGVAALSSGGFAMTATGHRGRDVLDYAREVLKPLAPHLFAAPSPSRAAALRATAGVGKMTGAARLALANGDTPPRLHGSAKPRA